MKAGTLSTFVARVDAAEFGICRTVNALSLRPRVRRSFQVVSRLGDGLIWYALMLSLLLVRGRTALRPVLVMAVVGVIGVALYKLLKNTLVRERPFITHRGISLHGAPLDRYSFPSGHTLHAVAFTWQAVAHFPELGWVLVPLTSLVAASRVVLGLHYPTDVLVGGAIGGLLAQLGLALG
ncbi:MAG TPA: phosphatase PAP2 family protein [Steroidobacteraceae bacterium]|nr:phosphatase PAP2 family protein [Steroidobacteraceae bacterium]